MTARLAIAAALTTVLPAAAQDASPVVGTWTVARVVEAAPDAPTSGLDALLPSTEWSLAPLRVAFAPNGTGTVWLLIARTDGYETVAEPVRWHTAGGRLDVSLDVTDEAGRVRPTRAASFAVAAEDGGLRLSGDKGRVYLRRE